MKFQPIVPVWLIIPYFILAAGAAGWQIWRVWKVYRTTSTDKHRNVLYRWIRRGALILLPAIIALGPSIPGGTSSPGVANLDVIFAVDTTPSMGATDYIGAQQRIDGVKKDLLALGARLQGARLEVISFDSSANIILPPTNDATAFSAAVEGLTPEVSSYSLGSAIDKPVGALATELSKSKATDPGRGRLLFYLGDGEQTSSAPVISFAPLAQYLSGGAVLGYGTAAGAKIINTNALSPAAAAPAYIMTVNPATQKLVPAISKMSPAALQKIATQLKVPFDNRNLGGSVDNIYQEGKVGLNVDKSQHIIRYLNLYWLLAVPFVVLIFWEWQILVTNLLSLRPQRGGKHA